MKPSTTTTVPSGSPLPPLHRGENDLVFTTDGRCYIDLVSGFGTALFGHAHPAISAALARQAERIWVTGRMETDILQETKALISTFLPESHQLAGFYSTGMEAAEYAMRVAAQATGRGGYVGFDRSMHGKSMATACLCWPSQTALLPNFRRLPFLPETTEADLLNRLEILLGKREVAAVFVEPFQGSGGGRSASREFYQRLGELARDSGTLVVADEVLCGFYRTGAVFHHPSLGLDPDLILAGKTLGNGFPVSAVFSRRSIELTPRMLPGSTYSENPLAAAVVKATLTEMRRTDLPAMVGAIEAHLRSTFAGLASIGCQLRGKGAFAVLETPPGFNMERIREALQENGVMASCLGPFIRILPAATIREDHLRQACAVIREALLAESSA